jgi:hypothetical protein
VAQSHRRINGLLKFTRRAHGSQINDRSGRGGAAETCNLGRVGGPKRCAGVNDDLPESRVFPLAWDDDLDRCLAKSLEAEEVRRGPVARGRGGPGVDQGSLHLVAIGLGCAGKGQCPWPVRDHKTTGYPTMKLGTCDARCDRVGTRGHAVVVLSGGGKVNKKLLHGTESVRGDPSIGKRTSSRVLSHSARRDPTGTFRASGWRGSCGGVRRFRRRRWASRIASVGPSWPSRTPAG